MKKIDIILLNKIKCNEIQANEFFSFNGFNCEFKTRSERAGGVAILVRSNIIYVLLNLDSDVEAKGIQIKINHLRQTLISYSRPSKKNDKNLLNINF